MKFTPTLIKGVYIIEIEYIYDERGFFGRSWCSKEYSLNGLDSRLCQCSVSFNKFKNTLRGMHYQEYPHEENKIVRCTMGSIFDVVADIRPNSETFGKWFSIELTAQNRKMIYVPSGVAHGFQSLEDNSEVFYMVSEFYNPKFSKTVSWNDPTLGIKWPKAESRIISHNDKNGNFLKA